MDNISVRQIANEITALAKESFEKSWDGNSKQANKAYRQCEKIKEKIAEDKTFLQELVKYTLSIRLPSLSFACFESDRNANFVTFCPAGTLYSPVRSVHSVRLRMSYGAS